MNTKLLSIEILDQGNIYEGVPKSPVANCCFPSLVKLSDGSLLASWRVGSKKESADGRIVLSRSLDEGETWAEPIEFLKDYLPSTGGSPHYAPLWAGDDMRVIVAVLWAEGLGGKPLFNPATEGLLPIRTLLYESIDGGKSWCEMGELDDQPYGTPMPMIAPPFTLPDGSLACPYEVNKRYDDAGPWRQASALKISRDGGKSWGGHVEVANDLANRVHYWDAHYAVSNNGFCIAAFWTYDHESKNDLNIHLSRSEDSGYTWSSPFDSGLVGQVAQPLVLSDGRLALIYVDRFKTRSIKIAISSNAGQTFEDCGSIYEQIGQDSQASEAAGTYLNEMALWTFGRVHAFCDDEERVWFIYYAGDEKSTGIHWACVKI